MKKEKILKKNNKVEFISAHLVLICWALPLDMALMLIRCYLCLALGSLFNATRDPQFVDDTSRLGCNQDGPSCSESLAFIITGSRGESENVPSYCRIFLCMSLPVSAGQSTVSVKLVADPTVFESASGRIRGLGLLDFPLEMPFGYQGRQWECFPTPKPLVWVCPG